ncbi:hypothetical protein AL755_21095 [Arthrobacter sp. ERGS1:01]|uniref:HtaA domain-containing protein n=1 Tax=Arthrobacter sp. ERGS1:01 TaxID=1704044 RepID=UPI0006B61E59|nr:HtaA domain-containing protein [Arthrobacter sp. ERGS1:01]ALE07398.1 hypothetical protein AL755_21095 [Arthrobacter sp. ERGS1:01]
MAPASRAPWWRKPLGLLAALAIAGSGVAATAPAAQAVEAAAGTVELTGGQLDWGVNKAFRNYISGNIAKGTITTAGGAATNADGTFAFPATGVDPAARTAAFGGSVAFSGHNGLLALTISDIRIDLANGLLLADVVSKSMSSGELVTYDDVKLATVGAGAQETGSAFAGTALPTALHADGVAAFSDSYDAGAAFDPLTFNVAFTTTVAAPVVGTSPSPVSVNAGETATFTAAAAGHESVQWQLSAAGTGAWTDIPGATSEQLMLTADEAHNGNLYRAAFTNTGGVVYSEAAALTVKAPAKVWTPALAVFAADGVTPLTSAVPEGTKVVVRGTGFDPEANLAPAGARPPISAGKPAGVYVVFGKFADAWKPSAGAPASARVVGDQKWAMSQAALDAVAPAYQSAIKGQWVEVSADGSFSAELTVQKKTVSGAPVEWPETGNFGAYTYPAGGTTNAAQELYAPITVGDAPKVWTPALAVFAADGVTPLTSAVPEGTKVVVRGTGFDPEANLAPAGARPPISAGKPAGVYVVFGKFADAWKPSAGAPASARVVGDQKWAMSQAALDAVAPAYQSAIKGQWVEVSADGSFSAELTVQKKTVSGAPVEWPETGNFGAYTYPAGGTTNAAQELYAPIKVGEKAPETPAPVLTVAPADGLKHGFTVSVTGSGYAPGRWIYVAEVAQGPGGNARPALYERAQRVQVRADGTFGPLETTVTTVFENGGFTAVKDKLFMATFNSPLAGDNKDHDYTNDRTQDAFTALSWADPAAPADPEPEVPGAVPALSATAKSVEAGKSVTFAGSNFTPGATVAFSNGDTALDVAAPSSNTATGGLDWGVKESFRKYLAGPIAKGTISTTDGAKANADGSYHFPATGFDAAAKVADFAGTITLSGHDGALEVTFSKLRLDVKNKVLTANASSKSIDGAAQTFSNVVLAELDTAAVTTDAVGVKGAKLPAVLSKAGAPAFANFYEAGEALDPVSFEVAGAPAQAVTVGKDGTFSAAWPVPAGQKPGRYAVTATATSAQPNVAAAARAALVETATAAIEVTAASKPVETPKPTTQPTTPPTTTAPMTPANPADVKCTAGTVTNGTLAWGVKDSFRKYITGNIAKGKITFNGKAAGADSVFTFTGGKGTIDAVKRTGTVGFDGTVAFTGHDYGSGPVLSVTFSNIKLSLNGDEGTLSADVLSRSLESATAGAKPGTDTSYKAVVLANLDLRTAALNPAKNVYAATAAPAVLAASGVAPFADFYAAGDALDGVGFALGCNASADLGTGNTGTPTGSGTAGSGSTGSAVVPAGSGVTPAAGLAKTGAMGLDASVIGALLVLLLGAGTMAGSRLVRRRH